MRDDFATFILTHGRADTVVTHKALERCGYTGKLFFLIDNEDDQADKYVERFGDRVIVFDKAAAAAKCDSGSNHGNRNGIVFARNACFEVAKSLGLRYFWQLDDDYPSFHWSSDNDGKYLDATSKSLIKNLDVVVEACVDFLIASKAKTVAFCQGGDFIGGDKGRFALLAKQGRFSRKAMNSFFCDVDNPINFRGVMNEDVSTYTESGRRGELFLTIPRLRLQQKATQSLAGGVTELYESFGTYAKAFLSVMYAPSCVKVSMMGDKHRRLHHNVRWRNAVPLVLSETYRKPRSI